MEGPWSEWHRKRPFAGIGARGSVRLIKKKGCSVEKIDEEENSRKGVETVVNERAKLEDVLRKYRKNTLSKTQIE